MSTMDEPALKPRAIPYRQLVTVIGEGAREIYGPDWELAERAAKDLWKTYEQTTGLSWADVEPDIRAAWERATVTATIW